MRVSPEKVLLPQLPDELSPASSRLFQEQLAEALANGTGKFEIDCASAHLISSRHIEMLWEAKLRCERSGRVLVLRRPSAGLMRILALLDLADLFVTEHDEGAGDVGTPAGGDGAIEAQYEDRFDRTLPDVTNATYRFRAFLGKLPIAELVRFELMTLFYEAANNIREHGAPSQERQIRCDARSTAKGLVLEFRDFGSAFDPCAHECSLPQPTATELPRRGYGLPLMRRMVDDMSYQRTADGQNVLTLTKSWGAKT